MKLKDIARININSANNQISLNLKSLKLKKINMSPKQLMDMDLPKLKKPVTYSNPKNIKGGFK